MINFDFFYSIFFIIIIFSSIKVVSSVNPLHSILHLILVFFCLAFILLLQQIEFLALVILIIYVGAIAVLFLFVIYMLNIKLIQLNERNNTHIFGIFCGIVCLFSLVVWFFCPEFNLNFFFIYENFYDRLNWENVFFDLNNLKQLGIALYLVNYFLFFIVGILLLVAMIGSIWLTSQKTFFLKEQVIFEQIKRYN